MTNETLETAAPASLLPPTDLSSAPAWMDQLRREGANSLRVLGLPTRRDEGWRYTNIDPLRSIPFERAAGVDPVQLPDRLARGVFSDLSCPRLVFLNGRLVPEMGRRCELPSEVRLEAFSKALNGDGAMLQNHLGRYAKFREHAFRSLNLAWLEEGALLHVPKGTIVEEPIQLLFLNLPGSDVPAMVHPRILIVAEESSQIRVVETHLGGDGAPFLNNSVTEILASPNAVVDYYNVQQESDQTFHLCTVEAQQGRSAYVRTTMVTLGGGLVRNDTGTLLNGEGGHADLIGLYLAGGNQHVDNFTRIEHAAAHCGSREVYKGILMDRATGVFRGRVIVHKGAQKTDSKQTNNNLLLSNDALINTKPQLEIYADDVKCTHGATIGQLEPESIFYLRSRGIAAEAARNMLIYAFAREVVSHVAVKPLHDALDKHLFEWLPTDEPYVEEIDQ